jgi:hypothetical protein
MQFLARCNSSFKLHFASVYPFDIYSLLHFGPTFVIAQARYALVDKQIAIVNQRNKIKSGTISHWQCDKHTPQ